MYDIRVMFIYLLLLYECSLVVFWFLHLHILLHDFTYAACGLHAILEQTIEQLGYVWDYDGHQYTTHGH